MTLLPMNLFGRWRKPDWEHKDASVRARAVRHGTDPALLPLLPEIAQRDPEAAVRQAAVARLEDPVLLARRMRGEHDAEVAATARGRLLDCLCSSRIPLERRRAVLRDVIDDAMLVAVAERAPETELRRDALEKIERPGVLFERCLADPDRSLRLWLLQRIDSPDVLERLAHAARKRDKTLTRAARERLQAIQLKAGDPSAVQRRVQSLCEQLDSVSRSLPADRRVRLQRLRDEWQALQPIDDGELVQRARAYFELAETSIEAADRGPLSKPGADTAADAVHVSAQPVEPGVPIEPIANAPESLPDPAFDGLASRLPAAGAADAGRMLDRIGRDAAALRDAQPGNPVVAAQYRRLADQLRQRAAEVEQHEAEQRIVAGRAVDRLEAAVREGSPAGARDALQVLAGMRLPDDLRQRRADAEAEIARLERWQRWSGNSVRARLCEQAEALHGSGLHPDALATRVKELQAEWARLDALEGEATGDAESGMARRFRARCRAALEPARGFFDKRRELQERRAAALASLLADTAELVADGSAEALVGLRRQMTAGLRELDDVPPQRRGELGRALRERLAAIDTALAERRERAALEKRRLLARLRRELGSADRAAMLDLAKSIQSEWKRLPRSERTVEDELWAELRGLVDPLFEAVRADHAQASQQQAESDAEATAILDELAALAEADDDRLAHVDSQLEAVATRWRQRRPAAIESAPPRSGGRDRDARRRPLTRTADPRDAAFDAAVERVRQASERAGARRAERSMQALCDAGDLLQQLQASDDRQRRDELCVALAGLPLTGDARAAVLARQQVITDGAAWSSPEADTVEVLAVRAELLAGLPSPDASGELRRHEQIRRLANRLEGGDSAAPLDEVRDIMVALQTAGIVERDRREQLQQRVLAAWRALAPGGRRD